MQKLRITFILLIAAVSVLSSGCEKRLIDYRNKYTGNYNLIYQTDWWTINGQSGSSTEHFSAVVYYDKHEKHKLHVKYTNLDIVVEVKKNGDVVKCDDVVGKFEENSFSFRSCGMGGHGGSGGMKYSGTRK